MNKIIDKIVNIEQLVISKNNVRADDKFDKKDAEDATLLNNIEKNHLKMPLECVKEGDKYAIIAGARRFNALKILSKKNPDKFRKVKIIISDYSDTESVVQSLSENITKKTMTPMQQAVAIDKVMKSGMKLKDVSEITGMSVQTVGERRGLLKLIPALQKRVESGKLGIAEANVIQRNKSQLEQVNLGELSPEQFDKELIRINKQYLNREKRLGAPVGLRKKITTFDMKIKSEMKLLKAINDDYERELESNPELTEAEHIRNKLAEVYKVKIQEQ